MKTNLRRLFLCLLSSLLLLVSCSSGSGTPNAGDLPSGRLLPISLTFEGDGELHTVPITWTENGCTIRISNYEIAFIYDPSDRCLDMLTKRDGKDPQMMENLCVFDTEGRLIRMEYYDETTPLCFSYEGDKIIATSMPEEENFTPTAILYDKENGRIALPTEAFASEENYLRFNQNGDILGTVANSYLDYTYDGNGNLTKLSFGEGEILIAYGEAPLTAVWQYAPLRMVWSFIFGTSMMLFSMSMLCITLA